MPNLSYKRCPCNGATCANHAPGVECGIEATSEQYVAAIFGFRMNAGVQQVQSYCRSCRASRRTPQRATTASAVTTASTVAVMDRVAAIAVEMEGGYTREVPATCTHTHSATCPRRCSHTHLTSCRAATPCRCCRDNRITICHDNCQHTCTDETCGCSHNCRTYTVTDMAQSYTRTYPCLGGRHDDGSISGVAGMPYEHASPPCTTLDALRTYVDAYHPDSVNASCGTHFHVSLKDDSDYDILATMDFYRFFLRRVQDLCNSYTNANNRERLQRRIDGHNDLLMPLTQSDIARQRAAERKVSYRYRHINFCETLSKMRFGKATIEFRIFHGMKTTGAIMEAANLIVKCIDEYIAARRAQPAPVASTESLIGELMGA